MSKFLGVLSFLFIVSFHSFAQTQTIKGKIVDEDGKGIANANVVQTGSRKGAQTDKDGNFLLVVKEAGKIGLSVSCVGYTAKLEYIKGTEATVILERKINVEDRKSVV